MTTSESGARGREAEEAWDAMIENDARVAEPPIDPAAWRDSVRWSRDSVRWSVEHGDIHWRRRHNDYLAGYSAAIEAAAKVADEMERCERGFQDLAARSQDAQRASDFEEGASIAKTIAAAVRALSPEEKT